MIFYILDIETTGLSVDFHDIVEISLIKVGDTPKESVQLNRVIKAERPKNFSIDALKVTGKTPADLYNGTSIQNAIKDVNDFMNLDGKTPQHRCIVAHNDSFDRKFVHAVWKKHNQEFAAIYWLDTLKMSRDLAKKQGFIKPKLSLSDACDLFSLKKVASKHNSIADTKNTYFLFNFLKNNVDYLLFIKNYPHFIKEEEQEDD